jgi:hypothetical protein
MVSPLIGSDFTWEQVLPFSHRLWLRLAACSSEAAGMKGEPARIFSRVELERVEEKDQGAKVTQTVTYEWTR